MLAPKSSSPVLPFASFLSNIAHYLHFLFLILDNQHINITMDALAGYASSEEEDGHHSDQEIAETKIEQQKAERDDGIEGLTNAQDSTRDEEVGGPPKTGNKAKDRPDSLNLPTTSGLFASLPAPSSKCPHLISQKSLIMETYSSDEEVDDVKKDGSKRRKIASQQQVVDHFNDDDDEYEEVAVPGAAAAGNELYRVDVGPMLPPPPPISVSVAGASSYDHHQPVLSPVEALLKQQLKDTSIQFTEVSATTLRGGGTDGGTAGAVGHTSSNVEHDQYIENLRRETAAMGGGRGGGRGGGGAVGKSIHTLYKMAKVQELEEYDKGGDEKKRRFGAKKMYGW